MAGKLVISPRQILINSAANQKITIMLKIIVFIFLLAGIKLLYSSYTTNAHSAETPVDKTWWDGLSAEWKTILLINQNFSNQRTDIFSLQNDYINRMNSPNEDDYSEINKSLHDLNELKKFGLGYPDFYARALKYKLVITNDSINLATLKDLDMIYMVNGPADLTPLKKFTKLRVLIINNCGVDNMIPLRQQRLNLEPLRYLKRLQILQCSSIALQSIEPIKELVYLQELNIDNSSVTDLSPLKNMVYLNVLSVGSKIKTAAIISQLVNLKHLYISGCKQIPDLSKLKSLKILSISENELAIVDAKYRITELHFLRDVTNLQFLDLDNTSYKGSLALLNSFQNLKAITLPPVNNSVMLDFKKQHNNCIIINAFKYER